MTALLISIHQSIANIVKSSLGPVGLDKMLVDDVGDVTVTNDGATILKNLEVEHPAAKVLCELADLQVLVLKLVCCIRAAIFVIRGQECCQLKLSMHQHTLSSHSIY